MKLRLVKPDEAKEFETSERCSILEVLNDVDDSAMSIARARVAVGVTTAWHHLVGVAERYVILQGQGRVEIGASTPQVVEVGDAVCIPAGVRQRIQNTGESDLIFYAICTPRFTPECYVPLEESELS
ncbi:cupin domain-containing protein [Coraliomargarita sp. W4R53]